MLMRLHGQHLRRCGMTAEFMNQTFPVPGDRGLGYEREKHKSTDLGPDLGFNAMGKPIPFFRQEIGYQTCREIGLDEEDAYSAVSGMSNQLERDKPYEAMEYGMRYLDLVGTYRLMAVLLTAGTEKVKELDDEL